MRPLILSIFALFLAGCTHSQQSMVDTFRASLFDNQDITVADQQIQALPYSTMYLRLNEGQRIFVVLGYIEQEQSKWFLFQSPFGRKSLGIQYRIRKPLKL